MNRPPNSEHAALDGKVAIVTGAAAGIGRQLVHTLLDAGAAVTAVDIDAAGLKALAAERTQAAQRLHCVAADMRLADSPQRIVSEALQRHGRFHVLINNAGIGRGAYAPDYLTKAPHCWEIDGAMWQRFLEINALGGIRLANAAVPHLLSNGWGRIINVTTSLDTMLRAFSGPYGASKAAFEAYSAILAHELASTGVTVNVLVPGGPVDTAMLPPTPGLARESLLKTDVMAAPLLWLASTASDGVTLRRFRANLWDEALSAADAAELSGSPIAWLGLASGQMRKPAATSQASQPA